jgi:hypothetical protein
VYDDGESFDDWRQKCGEYLSVVKNAKEKGVEERNAGPRDDDANLQQAIELSLIPNDEEMGEASKTHQEQPVNPSQHPENAARVVKDDDGGIYVGEQLPLINHMTVSMKTR